MEAEINDASTSQGMLKAGQQPPKLPENSNLGPLERAWSLADALILDFYPSGMSEIS